jgi:sulfite exporter TauE/SafE
MIALLSAVLIASLLGSTHCAGMCGAFMLFAVAESPPQVSAWRSRLALNSAYNLGRLVTYVLLGAAAGSLGAALDLGGSMLGVQRVAAVLAGAMMIVFGLVALARARGYRVRRVPLPAFVTRLVTVGHRRAADAPPLTRAWTIGMLTTLLPCGWLYAFAVTAAGTANPLHGAAVMAVFWAGTLPIMATLGLGAQALAGPLQSKLPLLTSILLVCVGFYTVLGRMALPAMAKPEPAVHQTILQGTVTTTVSDDIPPCCLKEAVP